MIVAEVATGEAQPKKSRKKIIAIVAAAALVLGGGIAAVVAKQSYDAETLAICEVATSEHAKAVKSAQAAVQAADDALEAVKSTELPDGAGTSTDYAARPGAEAVEAQKAEGDKPEVEAVPARPSAAELIEDATAARDALQKLIDEKVAECDTRDDAQALDAGADKLSSSAATLDEAVLALTDDFAVFQTEEAARIAAEKKAAEEAAAAAAAAEAEAARIAAEQAAQESWSGGYDDYSYDSGYSGGGGGYTGGGGGGGGGGNSGGGGMIAPPPGQSGGGCPPGTTSHVTNNGGTVSCW